MKLSRETDIMLIVLSFSILLSQLPCTITWYLIYYRSVLKNSNYDNVFVNGLWPIYLYTIRLIEMIYFSLNFFFYITLSPSLRREIKAYLSKTFSLSTSTRKPRTSLGIGGGGGGLSPGKNNGDEELTSKRDALKKENNSITPLPSPRIICKHLMPKSSVVGSKLRLHSNSSGEFIDYLGGKLRSISPLRRPNTLLKPVTYNTTTNDDNSTSATATPVVNSPDVRRFNHNNNHSNHQNGHVIEDHDFDQDQQSGARSKFGFK